MIIQIDTREKQRAIKKILKVFDSKGVEHISSKLYIGDYMSLDNPKLIIDRKQNLSEIYQNLCHGRKRFISEIERAQRCGIYLIILCEHGGDVCTLDDVKSWYNPQLDKTPYAWNGEKLYREMAVLQGKYPVKWLFCDKAHTGERIIELLEREE